VPKTMDTMQAAESIDTREEMIDFGEYAIALWRHRLVIVIATLVIGAAAFAFSLATPPTFEATAEILISPSRAADASPPVVATYRQILASQVIAAQVIREYELAAPPHNLTVDRFLDRHLSTEVVVNTQVVAVRVRLGSAALAASVANRIVELTVERVKELYQERASVTSNVVKAELDRAVARFDRATVELKEKREQSQIDLLRKDVETLLGQRGTVVPLLVDIASEKARLARAEDELARRARVATLRRSIARDPALMEAARQAQTDPAGLLGLQMQEEYLDGTYDELERTIAQARVRLSGLEEQRVELIGSMKLDAPALAKLTQLYAREIELSGLETEHELARALYTDVATQYEQIRLQVASRSAQVQVLDRAIPPARPVWPRPLWVTAVALCIGFALAVLAVLFRHFFSGAGRRPAVTPPPAGA